MHAYASVAEARAGIGLYLSFYNTKRPFSSIDRQTPGQACFKASQPIPVAAPATKDQMQFRRASASKPVMKHSHSHVLARLLAMLALALQVLLPGSMAVAQSNDVDVSRFICAPSGQISQEGLAAAQRLASLLGEDAPGEPPQDGHCPLCTMVHGVPLPEPVVVAAPVVPIRETVLVRFEPRLVCRAQGPPLGSRGPPTHI